MPKLNKGMAKKVNEAEGGQFEALEEGRYVVRLREVDASRPDGPAGPYWVWVFEIPEDYDHAGRRFWLNTSLSEKALWKLHEVFGAFGVTADTDTDELCGSLCEVYITQTIQQEGKNKGKPQNSVDTVYPYEGDDGVDKPDDEDEPF